MVRTVPIGRDDAGSQHRLDGAGRAPYPGLGQIGELTAQEGSDIVLTGSITLGHDLFRAGLVE